MSTPVRASDRDLRALAAIVSEDRADLPAGEGLALNGVGPDTAAVLLIAAADHPARTRSEAALAHLCDERCELAVEPGGVCVTSVCVGDLAGHRRAAPGSRLMVSHQGEHAGRRP